MRNQSTRRAGFTMLELQVAIILLAFGMVTMASLLSTQQRTLMKLRGDFVPASTLYVTKSNDPWQRQLNIPARVTNAPLVLGVVPTPAFQIQTIEILDVQYGLTDQSMTVTAETTLIP